MICVDPEMLELPSPLRIITWSSFLCQALKLIISCFSKPIPYPPSQVTSTLSAHSLGHPQAALWQTHLCLSAALAPPPRALEFTPEYSYLGAKMKICR